MKNILKACLNPKVLIGTGLVILLAYIFIPQVAQYSWILFVLVCPLSMMIMMAGMNHAQDKPDKVFTCPECGLSYREAEWAKKCAAWCKEHKSCNLEIIKHAIEQTKI